MEISDKPYRTRISPEDQLPASENTESLPGSKRLRGIYYRGKVGYVSNRKRKVSSAERRKEIQPREAVSCCIARSTTIAKQQTQDNILKKTTGEEKSETTRL